MFKLHLHIICGFFTYQLFTYQVTYINILHMLACLFIICMSTSILQSSITILCIIMLKFLIFPFHAHSINQVLLSPVNTITTTTRIWIPCTRSFLKSPLYFFHSSSAMINCCISSTTIYKQTCGVIRAFLLQ